MVHEEQIVGSSCQIRTENVTADLATPKLEILCALCGCRIPYAAIVVQIRRQEWSGAVALGTWMRRRIRAVPLPLTAQAVVPSHTMIDVYVSIALQRSIAPTPKRTLHVCQA